MTLARARRSASGMSAIVLGLGLATSTWAASPQDPKQGGQLNECWGQVASQTAKLDTPDGTSGGGMGQHVRSTQAADINGGFASDNGFGITFNVKEDGGNAGRLGVGNATRSAPHFDEPGDGGNGQHAINNGSDSDNGLGLSNVLDPVTGQFTAEPVELTCDLVP
jgi:hypothetical protein